MITPDRFEELLIALCAASLAFAWFEHRKAARLKRRIESAPARDASPPEPLFSQSDAPSDAPREEHLSRLKHDVKSPLTSILCFCSLLRHNPAGLTAKQSDYIGQIESSANAILVLLNQLNAHERTVEVVGAKRKAAKVTS
jgi:signal transduction histidine kinase